MVPIITRHWWILALRGAFAAAFGILAFAFPPLTFELLAIFIAAYLLIDGIFAIVAGVRAAERHRRWWPFLVEGIADLAAGVVVYFAPEVLIALVAVWAIVTGLLLLVPGFGLPAGAGKWLLILNGLISLALGVAIIVMPVAGVIFIVWSIGIYALLFGASLIALSLRIRALRHTSRALI